MLELAVRDLNEDERRFVRRFYQEGASLDAIARDLAVNVRTLSRLHDKIKAKLAKSLRQRGVTGVPPSERSV
jgi:DNA-directed RNA polymerase specialized sigma subunit